MKTFCLFILLIAASSWSFAQYQKAGFLNHERTLSVGAKYNFSRGYKGTPGIYVGIQSLKEKKELFTSFEFQYTPKYELKENEYYSYAVQNKPTYTIGFNMGFYFSKLHDEQLFRPYFNVGVGLALTGIKGETPEGTTIDNTFLKLPFVLSFGTLVKTGDNLFLKAEGGTTRSARLSSKEDYSNPLPSGFFGSMGIIYRFAEN